jgi:hypothetical protein
MKTTHLALGGIVVLLVIAAFLMMDSANDKKLTSMQDKMDRMKAKPTPAAVVDAPPQTVEPSAALPPNAIKPAAPTTTGNNTAATTPKDDPATPGIDLPNPTKDLNLAAEEKALLDKQIAIQDAQLQGTQDRTLNPLQVKIKNLPAIAKVKKFNEQFSFVELDAGKNRKLEKGMKFNIRHDAMIVGKITIGDTVNDSESIADLDPNSVPPGAVILPGYEVIQFE